jgi:hypothetical protein
MFYAREARRSFHTAWTHLCHKPVGGADRDSAVQQPYLPPQQAGAVLFWPPQSSLAQEGQMSICLRRREFIAALGGAASWPLAARAQQDRRVRRVGALMPFAETDRGGRRAIQSFREGLADLGWIEGRNLRIDVGWAGPYAAGQRSHALAAHSRRSAISPGGELGSVLCSDSAGRGRKTPRRLMPSMGTG